MLLACTLSAVLGACSAPALALSQRGHVFSFSFSTPGAATGVAVNESNGHVYFAAAGAPGQPKCATGCVDEFEPAGTGEGETLVNTFEVPAAASIAVDNSAGSPSRGDVYVAGTTKKAAKEGQLEDNIVYKFSATGAPLLKLKKFKTEPGETEAFAGIVGLAVDSGGNLFAYDEEAAIARFNNAAKNKSLLGLESGFVTPPTRGLAVDPVGRLYVGHVSENAGAEGPAGEPPVVGRCAVVEQECEPQLGELDREATTAVAVNSANEVFADNVETIAGKKVTSVVAFNAAGSSGASEIEHIEAPGLSEGNAIAADSSSGAVYTTGAGANQVDVFELEPPGPPRVDGVSECVTSQCNPEASTVKLTARVDPSGADTHAYFEYSGGACTSSTCKTPARDLGGGFGDQSLAAEPELSTLQEGVTYHFHVVATNEHGEVSSAEHTFTIPKPVDHPPLPDGRAWEMVSPPNKDGLEVEPISNSGSPIQASRDGSAMTYIASGPIPADREPEGNRAPEGSQILSVRGPNGWTSQDLSTANSVGFGANVGLPIEYQQFSPNFSLALLEPYPGPGQASRQAQPPLSPPVSEQEKKLQEEGLPYQEKTPYLRANAPLLPEAGNVEAEKNYAAAKEDGENMKNAGFLALVTEANALAVLGSGFGGGNKQGVEALIATPDLSRVLMKSWKAAPGLYEWGPGSQLQLVSALPRNAQGEEPSAGVGVVPGQGPDLRHAISDTGSRVFWTDIGTHHLYVRDLEQHETLQLDVPEAGAGAGLPDAVYQTASADGTKVFFTDTQHLSASSKAVNSKAIEPDLYVYELSPQGQPLSASRGRIDLTPEGVHGESAAIQGFPQAGGVLGASEDGSYVYFVANGALAPGNTPGTCFNIAAQAPERSCNLYVMHLNGGEWEAPKLIAVLSNDDAPDWGGAGFPGDLATVTSRVSPNGRYLAFMSERSLTGYNNEDTTSEAEGERRDEEVFLYDASKETLVCASCNPSGTQPHGVRDPGSLPDPERGPEESIGLIVDQPKAWGESELRTDHWLAASVPGWTPVSIDRAFYQSRYLSDTGRLFFNSPDHLVPAAAGSKEKVYEYEPSGQGSCESVNGCVGVLSSPNTEGEPLGERESAFLDASESGNDVFFMTTARLPAVNGTSGDFDTSYDVYDARVCEPRPSHSCAPGPALGSGGCENETACKGTGPHTPEFLAPASRIVHAPGNVPRSATLPIKEAAKRRPVTRAQLLAKALKLCHTTYKAKSKKKQLAACEARARKRYGHTSGHKASEKASQGSPAGRKG
jgi:hypothetical protein